MDSPKPIYETSNDNNLDVLYSQSASHSLNQSSDKLAKEELQERNKLAQDYSTLVLPNESDAVIATRLGLSPLDFKMSLTCIGGAIFNNYKLESVVSKFIITAIKGTNSELQRRNQNLFIGAAATTSGVMKMMGEARLESQLVGTDFTLLGVIPNERVLYPGNNNLEPVLRRGSLGLRNTDVVNHDFSHLVITQNGHFQELEGPWQTMSDRLCNLTHHMGTNSTRKTLVINGGEGTGYELPQKLAQREEIIVVKGSGRFADALVTLLEGKDTEDLTDLQRQYLQKFEQFNGNQLNTLKHKIKIFDLLGYKDIEVAAHDLQGLLLE
jgi:hypothetical protein